MKNKFKLPIQNTQTSNIKIAIYKMTPNAVRNVFKNKNKTKTKNLAIRLREWKISTFPVEQTANRDTRLGNKKRSPNLSFCSHIFHSHNILRCISCSRNQRSAWCIDRHREFCRKTICHHLHHLRPTKSFPIQYKSHQQNMFAL